ncbi:glycosyltransferase family protein [Parabacteroides timonensis]|uniref:hypothetical protein n=1 Tax=Parabacteroides timonensis TaxID=1871013 RepID=UPI00094E851B|nr:hypothetical protein [Parabacteroides timonensis]
MTTQREIRKIDIIEKFSPRHPSIAGRSVKLMADILHSNGLDVHTFSIDAVYKGQVAEKIRLPYPVTELKAIYNGNNKILRLLVGLLDGFRLVFSACRMTDADVRIVLTNPSLINFWAALFKYFSRSRWVFWTMDLYPDAFCSAGLVKSTNPLFRIIHHWVYQTAPDYMIALGERQYAYLKEKYKKEIPHTVLPAGVNIMKQVKEMPDWKEGNKDKITMCYAGNLGEAHDALFLFQLIDRMDPEKFMILLALYGSKANWLLEKVRFKQGVVIVNHVELEFIDINIASLLPCWNHVCVPSKVVSAICAGTSVLYNASEYSEGYCMFPKALWLISETDDYERSIVDFYHSVTREIIDTKKQAAREYARQLVVMQENAFQEIIQYCKNTK